jgi:cysteine desulfurase/selenocysteine lyase
LHERELMRYAMKRLGELADIRIYGPKDPDARGGVVSFTHAEIHAHDLATILDKEGVAIRAGHHCNQPLMRRLGVAATARASFYIYNTTEDVDALIEALKKANEVFGVKLKTVT